MKAKETAFVPLEFGSRDLMPGLLLSSHLLQAGLRVVIGYRNVLRRLAATHPSSVWIGKDDPRDGAGEGLPPLFFLPDEGGVWDKETWESWVLRKYYADGFASNPPERLLTWGEAQAHLISTKFPSLTKKVKVSGTPRFDFMNADNLWITDEQTRSIERQHGSFVLINTRFSLFNHPLGPTEALRKMLWERTTDQYRVENSEHLSRLWLDSLENAVVFLPAVRRAALEFPDSTFVIRPHPDENPDLYRHFFFGLDNVHVDRRFGSVAWIRASQVVVGSHCSTGIEAVLAEKPFINIAPGNARPGSPKLRVVGDLGRVVTNERDFVEAISNHLHESATAREEDKSVIHNFVEPSSPIIVSEVLSAIREGVRAETRLNIPKEINPRRWGYKFEAYKLGKFERAQFEDFVGRLGARGVTSKLEYFGDLVAVLDPA